MRKPGSASMLAALSVFVALSSSAAEEQAARPKVAGDGTVHVPAFDLPPSELMSERAVFYMKMRMQMAGGGRPSPAADIDSARKQIEESIARLVSMTRSEYHVDIAEEKIAGVRTRVFTPKGKPVDPDRVLINLHGGAFALCADGCAVLESTPIAALSGYKVISVDYRMAPEAKHPAAIEDLAAVYREVLKTYQPKRVGIYGCSAGGALAAQAGAWFPAHELPQPGAIGIFGSGAVRFGAGDSAYISAYVDGSTPPPGQSKADPTWGYFAGVDMRDKFVSPALYPEVLAKFPPVLIITGTRAQDMSPAVYTNSKLLKAGIASTLVVGEGMGHCYIYQSPLAEAQDAYAVIVNFFKANLQ